AIAVAAALERLGEPGENVLAQRPDVTRRAHGELQHRQSAVVEAADDAHVADDAEQPLSAGGDEGRVCGSRLVRLGGLDADMDESELCRFAPATFQRTAQPFLD